jgi:hypothetical protein
MRTGSPLTAPQLNNIGCPCWKGSLTCVTACLGSGVSTIGLTVLQHCSTKRGVQQQRLLRVQVAALQHYPFLCGQCSLPIATLSHLSHPVTPVTPSHRHTCTPLQPHLQTPTPSQPHLQTHSHAPALSHTALSATCTCLVTRMVTPTLPLTHSLTHLHFLTQLPERPRLPAGSGQELLEPALELLARASVPLQPPCWCCMIVAG